MFDKNIIIDRINTGGDAIVVNEYHEIEADVDAWSQSNKPEVKFSKIFYLNDHDSRLYLSSDTYVQLILGSGMVISGDKPATVKKVKKWIEDNYIEEKIEDGAHSYVITGNLIYELLKAKNGKKILDIEEADITTIISAERNRANKVLSYTQYVNNKEKQIKAEHLAHLKFTNRRQELWGRSLFQSIISPKEINGELVDSAVEEMWAVEHAMVKIFQSYASPIMMIHFKDVGEDFIKDKQQEFKKIKPGAKILTDKEFEAKVFEVNPASKFDKYIEHLEKDVIQAGGQFASQILTAGFTARASSESASDIIKLKIKRIQRRFGLQIKKLIIDRWLDSIGIDSKEANIQINFQFDSESVLTIQDVIGLFEKGTMRRSEVRKYIADNTDVEIDMNDMEDTLPITSVTPTNDLKNKQGENPNDKKPEIQSKTDKSLNELLDISRKQASIYDRKLDILEKISKNVNEVLP